MRPRSYHDVTWATLSHSARRNARHTSSGVARSHSSAAKPVTGGGACTLAVPGCGEKGDSAPNGSRLSCGASAGKRKRSVLRDLRAGAQTYASSKSRPRQLQAHVRRRHLLSQPPQQCARRAPQRPLGVPAPPGTASSDTSARRVPHCRTRLTLYAVSPRPRRS